MLPDAVAQDRTDIERGDLQPRVLGRPGDEVDVRVTVVERQVEVPDRPTGEQLGAQLALGGVLDGRLDGREGGGGPVEPQPGLDDGVVDLVGIGVGEPLAGVRTDGLAQDVGDVEDTGEQLGVVEDPAQRGGQGDEPAGRQLGTDRVAHDVLEHVGLVEHHDVVRGEDHPAAADVQPVEVGVDDDDVRGRRPAAGLLGEARLAERAAIGARAFVAADAERPPRGVRR